MSFMKGDLLTRMRVLVKGGIRPKPRWFDAVSKVPPAPFQEKWPKPPKIKYPEDPLVESYYARHPDSKFTPFKLQGFDSPIARQFALRQLELMEQGMSKRDARDQVEQEFEARAKAMEEQEMAERRRALRDGVNAPPVKKSVLEEIQEEEWQRIHHGLEVIGTKMELEKGVK